DQRDLERLPFAGRPHSVDGRREKSVQATHAQRVECKPVVVLDLHLVTAAQVNAAVAAGRETELRAQAKIAEVPIRDEVDARRPRFEHAADDAPAIRVAPVAAAPACAIAVVEERNRLAPGPL